MRDAILNYIPEDLLEALLDNPYESLILVDADGIVRFMSSSNEGVYPIPVNEAIGKHIRDVSPNTHLPRILKTGKAEIGRSMVVQSKSRVIARIPLIKDGRIVGAVGKLMFMSPEKLRELYKRIKALESKIIIYQDELSRIYGGRYSFDSIIGDCEAIRKAKKLARQAAGTDAAVIITGESGTGKELFAQAIHKAGARCKHNFVRVNCGAIPAELIEAELFGYEPGAFTGARRQGRAGKFELSHHGTIFLDEIGDMSMSLQVKLMRVLQEKEVERLGGGKPKPVDFRVISATNRDIRNLINQKAFRLDLYYRINVLHIHLPPLREIQADIQPLFNHFLRLLAPGRRNEDYQVAAEVFDAMRNYAWPGNIRELRNVVERAMIVCRNNRIELGDLHLEKSGAFNPCFPSDTPIGSLKMLIEKTERQAIMDTLEKTGGNRTESAKQLGMHRTGLYQKMKKYGIS